MQHDKGYVIRTHDRMAFLECRQSWDWSSKIRQNFEPNIGNVHMDFGTAIHAALEQFYHPLLADHWDVRCFKAIIAFNESWGTVKDQYDPEEYYERVDLGTNMLNNYFEWATHNDTWEPMHVELEFEVQIKAPAHVPTEEWATVGAPFCNINGYLYKWNDDELGQWWPVYYQGRIDLVARDRHGKIVIVDHKTAGRLEDTEHLEMDEQCGSYAWALQEMLGIQVDSVIYNELYKGFPGPPKQLASGKFSKDKTQNTTRKIYEETLAEYGQSVVGYEDFLTWLDMNERQYVRRTPIHRSQQELRLLGERIGLQAIDMLNDPSIYPAPTKFKCGRCQFRTACLAKMDGSDHDWVLNESFHKRA